MQIGYAELLCTSNFSFLVGASHPEELVTKAHALGYKALAITDECTLAGVVRAHVAAKAVKLKLIVGCQIRLAEGPRLALLADSKASYAKISALITQARRAAPKGHYQLAWQDLEAAQLDCPALWVAEANTQAPLLLRAKALFGDGLRLAVTQHCLGDDWAWLEQQLTLANQVGVSAVAVGDVLMHTKLRKKLQDVLTAVRHGQTVAHLGARLEPNAERYLRPIQTIAARFPVELIARTLDIASCCTFSLDELRYEYPQELVPPGQTPSSHLRQLTYAGLARRRQKQTMLQQLQTSASANGVLPDDIGTTLERELALIAQMRYEPFFLTVHDIVMFAKSQGILCQGRGSAANSAVCFCLGITEIDPSRMQMLFERFISKERGEPPDIDVDFEHERREEVIQYIYQKYGRHRTALAATLITYRGRSALRDVGKALGLDADQITRLSGSVQWWDDIHTLHERLSEAGLDADNRTVRLALELAREIIGFPRHLSQHVGGFVIAQDELSNLVPIENASMPDRTVIQWDKDDLEALGLLKVDVLGLGMLTAIRKTLTVLNDFYGTHLGLDDIPPEDSATYDMLCAADTIGVFQVESRAQMSMLPRLKPRQYYDLVIEVAIVRPGPIEGGMVHPYLRRRDGLDPVTYPSAAVRSVLVRTLGVPIFQEQVMQLAVVAAGFTPGEADLLRRAMAAWKKKGGLAPFRDKFIGGMLARGYEGEFAERIYKQISGFGEYGFPESHAASFALLVYISAWLKCHYPAAFACGLLNAQPLGFYSPSQIIQDAERHGVQVLPIDVTISDWDSTLEEGHVADGKPMLRLGLRRIKGLSQAVAEAVMKARAQGKLTDLNDLASRASLNARDLKLLAEADALMAISGHRRHAFWQALGVAKPTATTAAPEDRTQPLLPMATESENVLQDYASTGHSLRRHPLALLRAQLATRRIINSAQLAQMPHGRLVRVSGLVTCKQRPGTAKGVLFVTLEDEAGNVNIVVWSRVLDQQRTAILAAQLMTVYGKLERVGAVTHVVAQRIVDDTRLLNGLVPAARNFH